MIFDDFFKDPLKVREDVMKQEATDRTYMDGVTYPHIALLPVDVLAEVYENLSFIVGPKFDTKLAFARYSFEGITPPHWAHSDREISQFLALIYLTEGLAEKYGTLLLRHTLLDFESHPDGKVERRALLHDANKPHLWDRVFECPGKFNRCFILNADLIHAAAGQFGTTKDDGRLVISVFFNLG